jgi:hypothetical protein
MPFAGTVALFALAIFLPANLALKAAFLVVAIGAFAAVCWFRLLSVEERALAGRLNLYARVTSK